MNTFATLAVLFCACLIGSCHGIYGSGGHGGYGQQGVYGQSSNGGAASAASSAAAAGNQRPVEIIAGGPRGGYGHGQEILRPISLGYSQRAPQHGSYGRRGGYGPRWTVQPAGATLLYPGQNNYRAYVSPPEYTKVVLPIRAAEPVAKLYIPENRYGSQQGYGNQERYGNQQQQSYNVETSRY